MTITTESAPNSMAALETALREVADSRQVIGHFGAIEAEGSHRSWWSIRYDDAVPKLLATPDYKVAQILGVLGSEVRLAILRCLLSAPRTAAEIVSELRLGTTGQAYHHLRELERAGYVEQRAGRYHFEMRVGRVYLTALALAADAGAESPEAPV
jgi:DNA-binding transcriptional ArsR family regulator